MVSLFDRRVVRTSLSVPIRSCPGFGGMPVSSIALIVAIASVMILSGVPMLGVQGELEPPSDACSMKATPANLSVSPLGISKPITIDVSQATFDLKLVPGWNLVSIPLVDHGYRANTLPLIKLDLVIRWNTSGQFYDQVYVSGVSPPSCDFAIEGSTGYWIYAGSAETLHLLGNIPISLQSRTITVPASGGWAFIGFSMVDWTRHASDVPKMYSGGVITMVFLYDPVAMVWKMWINGIPQTDFLLRPGVGYLVWCTSGTLAYSP